MLALISPAKKLDFDSETIMSAHTQPDFLDKADKLVTAARQLSRKKLAQTMHLSDSLAELNFQRFKDFETPFDLGNAKQAALVFNGDTYVGLKASTFDEKDFEFAQNHLRILSGLYGLLRPLDLIQPYRLEMGARFSPPRKKDLYDFWQGDLTAAVLNALDDHQDKTVINLASNEYFKAVDKKQLNGNLITPAFKETKDGETRMIGMFAKQARGMMARYMVQNRIESPEGLKDFNLGGYKYQKSLSDDQQWVFTRKQPPPVGAKKAA